MIVNKWTSFFQKSETPDPTPLLYLLSDSDKHFDGVQLLCTWVQVMLTHVYSLFLLDCLVGTLRLCRSDAFLIPKGICRVASLLVELGASAIVALLLDNEVRRSVQVGICCGAWVQCGSWVIHILSILESVGVFADVEK